MTSSESAQPFVRYRERLDSYSTALKLGFSDDEFVDLVWTLDERVEAAGGTGFRITPLVDGSAVADALDLDVDLVIKAEPNNVGGSHKARHLFGVALDLLVRERDGASGDVRLAIASCGNAAVGAAVVARALDRPLDVFVPTWADHHVLTTLDALGASIQTCERREGEAGDPCYLRFEEAVADGARPFSVQSTMTPTTLDGGRTIGWEFADQLDEPLDALYVQVGGGALATSVALSMPDVRIHPVQSVGCAPLARAWHRLAPDFDFAAATANPDAFMTPWEDPTSAATGILDDVTYDWLTLLERTHATGGTPVVAPESAILTAHDVARHHTDVEVCITGTAGLAGLVAEPPATRERVGVFFTGIDRTAMTETKAMEVVR